MIVSDRRSRCCGFGATSDPTPPAVKSALADRGALIEAFTKNYVPLEVVEKIAAAIIGSEVELRATFWSLDKMRGLPVRAAALDGLNAKYQAAWIAHNEVKFFAMLVPAMQRQLLGRVKPPSIDVMRANSGLVARFMADHALSPANAAGLKREGAMVDGYGMFGIDDLLALAGAAAVLVTLIGGIFLAYEAIKALHAASDNAAVKAAVACEAAGKCPNGTATALAHEQTEKDKSGALDWLSGSIPWIAAAIVAVTLGPALLSRSKA